MHNNNASTLPQFSNPRLVYEHQNDRDTITVLENYRYRWIQSSDGSIQSAMNLAEPYAPVLPYFPVLLSALLFTPPPSRTLVIGLGGGELIRFFSHYFPQSQLTAVEKSTHMSNVFREYFSQETNELELINGDICEQCVNDTSATYKLIFLDVYADKALPDCFNNSAFFEYLARLLDNDGVIAINLVVNSETEAVQILQLIRQAFDRKTLCLAVGSHMNLVVLAFKQTPATFADDALQELAAELSQSLEIDYQALVTNILSSNPNDDGRLSFY